MSCIVFPGQGSQSQGMVKDFYENFKLAGPIFEEIEDYTKIDIRNIIFNNDNNKLNLTQFTQICIFSASYVIFKIIENEKGFENINFMMGHSLGEYTALTCSNKLSLRESSITLKKRGELMNNAVLPNETGMAALIGKDFNSIQEIIDKNNLDLEIANDNSNIQIVISGKVEEINRSREIFLDNKIKKFVFLNVSAAFHSKFMLQAQNELSKVIEKLNFIENKIKIISNYDGEAYNNNSSIKRNLQSQMGRVFQLPSSPTSQYPFLSLMLP